MASKAQFIQKTPILEPGRLAERLSLVVAVAIVEFKQLVKDNQVFGEHSGRIYASSRINGGRARHQASAPGESPAPITFALVNSTESEQLTQLSGEVRVTKSYGAILQNKMERDITTSAQIIYAPKFEAAVAQAVGELL